MSDKLVQQVSVIPQFVDGEAARAGKLNSLGSQLRRAAQTFEKAIGDMTGDSWPYSALNTGRLTAPTRLRTSNAVLSAAVEPNLDIASLARAIGPMSKLNPRLPMKSVSITEVIPTGVHSFKLTFKPDSLNSIVPASSGASMAGARVSVIGDITGNQWSASSSGIIYSAAATHGGTITYTSNAAAFGGGMSPTGGSFNSIPDPNQVANGNGVTVSGPDGSGRYQISLPTVTRMQSNHTGDSVELAAKDPYFSEQLTLPLTLTEHYSTAEPIPGGYVYLKNWTTNELYTEASYSYNNETTLYVSNVDLSTEIANGDVFYLITVGVDLTTAVGDLQRKLFHKHNGEFGEPLIDAADIAGWTAQPGGTGVFVPSKVPGNYAPQYMHRDGWKSSGESTLNDGNAMRGDIKFGRTDGVPGTFTSTSGITGSTESYGLRFTGNGDPRIYWNSTLGLAIRNSTSSGIWINSSNNVVRVAPDYTSFATGIVFEEDASTRQWFSIHEDFTTTFGGYDNFDSSGAYDTVTWEFNIGNWPANFTANDVLGYEVIVSNYYRPSVGGTTGYAIKWQDLPGFANPDGDLPPPGNTIPCVASAGIWRTGSGNMHRLILSLTNINSVAYFAWASGYDLVNRDLDIRLRVILWES